MNRNTVESSSDIVNLLEKNKSLKKLNLAYNHLGDKGIESIAKALEENKTLKSLNLTGNNISDEGLGYIIKTLEKNKSLIHLNLFANLITDKGAKLLRECINNLISFDISNNLLKDEIQ